MRGDAQDSFHTFLWKAFKISVISGIALVGFAICGAGSGLLLALAACCALAGLPAPRLPFVCTVDLARKQWNLRPTKLPDVCRFLGLDLDHHHAQSDAEACARIVMAAVAEDPGCLIPFGV